MFETIKFNNEEFGEIRTVVKNGEPWFCGKDVCEAFGDTHYRRNLDKVNPLDKDVTKMDTPGGKQSMTVINESGLYALLFQLQFKKPKNIENATEILSQRQEKLDKFKRWVTSEVLPQIRKTGGYIPIKQEDSELEIMSKAFLIAQRTLAQKDELIAQQNKLIEIKDNTIKEQKPLVDFAVQVADTTNLIDMKGMAKLLKDENITIGRTRLFDWLRNKKILMADNTPYQNYIDREYFVVKESLIPLKNGRTKTALTTYITGKGQIYIVNRIKREYQTN